MGSEGKREYDNVILSPDDHATSSQFTASGNPLPTILVLTFGIWRSYAPDCPRLGCAGDNDPRSKSFPQIRESGSKYVTMTRTFLGLHTCRTARYPKRDVKGKCDVNVKRVKG